MKNKYEIIEDKVYIELSQGQVGIIDLEDLGRVDSFKGKWYAARRRNKTISDIYYVQGAVTINGKQKTIQLHKWLLDLENRWTIDHINHNGLDNTRENLRVCTAKDNCQNRRAYGGKSSKYKGVAYRKDNGMWRVMIRIDDKLMHLGQYTSETEAAKRYDEEAKKYFNEYDDVLVSS
jgi:hypothetical protein